jgi:hypothetical protein
MELDLATFDLPLALDNAMTLVRGRAERKGSSSRRRSRRTSGNAKPTSAR